MRYTDEYDPQTTLNSCLTGANEMGTVAPLSPLSAPSMPFWAHVFADKTISEQQLYQQNLKRIYTHTHTHTHAHA